MAAALRRLCRAGPRAVTGYGAVRCGAVRRGLRAALGCGGSRHGHTALSRRRSRRAPRRGHRLTPSDDEMYQRTRVTVLQPESPNVAFIEGYSGRGFSISGSVVVGPCAVLPRAILQWNVSGERGWGRGGEVAGQPR